MNPSRIDIRTIRRDQIIEAAIAVIAEQGIQNLSLSEIEKKAGMKSRGQLTYYFHAKEDILLGVFDRLLQLIYERLGKPQDPECLDEGGWDRLRDLLQKLLSQPPVSPEFHILQYTFLSQIGYREDFRERLATLYEEWRRRMAEGLAPDLVAPKGKRVPSPRAMATLIQAILHGLGVQLAADPKAFQGAELAELCIDLLSQYFPGKTKAAAMEAGRQRTNGNK